MGDGRASNLQDPKPADRGAYSLFEVTTQPGAGPPPHVQHREDESFYVLEREFEFSNGDESHRAGVGFLFYVPKGTLHDQNNVSEGVGRMLISQTQGDLYGHFFEEMDKAVGDEAGPSAFEDQPDVQRIVATGVRYGIEIRPRIAQ